MGEPNCKNVNSEAGEDNSSCIQSSIPSTISCKSGGGIDTIIQDHSRNNIAMVRKIVIANKVKCREGLRMLLLLHAIISSLHTCMNCNSSLW